jgi:predicted outer membrane repeat protein/parallel beta-helix repeat protein
MIHPGTYYEHDIDFLGKAITVMGTDPEDSAVVASTVVDGSSLGSVFVFQSGEDSTSILAGLTIRGGNAWRGGGIHCDSSSPKITNCVISGNSSGWGGGINCDYSSPIVINCTFSWNWSELFGGGIYCGYLSSPQFIDCTISDNVADTSGGGFYCEQVDREMNITNCTISRNECYSRSAWEGGGGIRCYDAWPTITGCHFEGNAADFGNDISCTDQSQPSILDCTFMGSTGGEGIFCKQSSPTIMRCLFEGNGNKIRASWSSSPTITDCEITNGWGTGIFCDNNSNAIINGCIISNNFGTYGRGIRCLDSSPTIVNCIISGNSTRYDGGGILCDYWSNPIIKYCTISGNQADETGGGITCDRHSDPIISNCIIIGNSSFDGGGLYCNDSSNPTIKNCIIAENTAEYGSGLYSGSSTRPTIINSTFTNNSASSLGGALYCEENSDPTISNSILWGDTAALPSLSEEVYFEVIPPSIFYSNVEGSWPGASIINADPLFVNSDSSDYHLSSDSPCVDSGTDAGVYIDYEGDTRPVGYGFDMGADESSYSIPYNLTLTPDSTLSIPKGDTLYFSSLLQNNTDNPIEGDYWLTVQLPNTNEVVIPENFLNYPNPMSGQISANNFLDLAYELYVPAVVGTGSYNLIGRIGVYPDNIIDEESFGFRVVE